MLTQNTAGDWNPAILAYKSNSRSESGGIEILSLIDNPSSISGLSMINYPPVLMTVSCAFSRCTALPARSSFPRRCGLSCRNTFAPDDVWEEVLLRCADKVLLFVAVLDASDGFDERCCDSVLLCALVFACAEFCVELFDLFTLLDSVERAFAFAASAFLPAFVFDPFDKAAFFCDSLNGLLRFLIQYTLCFSQSHAFCQ